MIHGHLNFSHKVTNNSDRFVLVGNAAEMISHHATEDEAYAALRKINVGESKWGVIRIVAPGEEFEVKDVCKTVYTEEDIDESLLTL